MRRPLLVGLFLLDGLCALAAPAVTPMVLAQVGAEPDPLEVTQACVEESEPDETGVVWRSVSTAYCAER